VPLTATPPQCIRLHTHSRGWSARCAAAGSPSQPRRRGAPPPAHGRGWSARVARLRVVLLITAPVASACTGAGGRTSGCAAAGVPSTTTPPPGAPPPAHAHSRRWSTGNGCRCALCPRRHPVLLRLHAVADWSARVRGCGCPRPPPRCSSACTHTLSRRWSARDSRLRVCPHNHAAAVLLRLHTWSQVWSARCAARNSISPQPHPPHCSSAAHRSQVRVQPGFSAAVPSQSRHRSAPRLHTTGRGWSTRGVRLRVVPSQPRRRSAPPACTHIVAGGQQELARLRVCPHNQCRRGVFRHTGRRWSARVSAAAGVPRSHAAAVILPPTFSRSTKTRGCGCAPHNHAATGAPPPAHT
jgi:hypothetical protein